MTKVYPVLHYKTIQQSLDNATTAVNCGCPGVFLISMDGEDDELDQAIMAIKYRFPDLKVGGNYLTLSPLAALKRCLEMEIAATWADKPGVSSRGVTAEADEIAKLLKENPEHKFFGSVAFKYQAHDPDPVKAALDATRLGMIATTSGAATGVAADVDKLRLMKAALGNNPLGLASGVSPENAGIYAPYVDYILVSTHVSTSPNSDILCPEKLTRLMQVVGETF